jgi:hypothetical protein
MHQWMQLLPQWTLGVAVLGSILAFLGAGWGQTSAATSSPKEAPRQVRKVPAVCNISDAACQAELLHVVTASFDIRGGFRAPEVRFVSGATLAKLNEDDAHGQLVSTGVRGAMMSLGLLQRTAEAEYGVVASSQQAVYRSRTHDVLLALPESERGKLHGNVMLVHELVHAVQAHHGLFAQQKKRGFDQRLAWRARLEGEAVVRSHRFKAELEGLDPSAIDWQAVFGSWSERSLQSIGRARFPLVVAVATLPYARGALWYESLENPASARWPDRFGELFGDPAEPDATVDTTENAAAACRSESEELGALSLLAFLLAMGNEPDAYAAARDLRSDLLCVHPDGDFSWQLVWSAEAGAAAAALVQQRALKLGLGVRVQTPSNGSSELRVTIAGGA